MSQDTTPQSPFTRPGFLAAAGLVCLVAVLGLVLGVLAATRSNQPPVPTAQSLAPTPPTPGSEAAPATEAPTPKDSSSICGLQGEVLEGRLVKAPEAQWEYQGTTAYPTSPKYGPAKTDSSGVRYCFQRSPEGALFAAANAVAQGGDPQTIGAWLTYFLAEGPHRNKILNQGPEGDMTYEGVRIEIAGFRILSYDGSSARVDIALRGTAQGKTVYLSAIYSLIWENGDWKLTVSDPDNPINTATIPDVVGYIPWRP